MNPQRKLEGFSWTTVFCPQSPAQANFDIFLPCWELLPFLTPFDSWLHVLHLILFYLLFFSFCYCCCCNYGSQYMQHVPHISDFSQLQQSNSGLCTMQRLVQLELRELPLSSTSYQFFVAPSTIAYPTIVKVTIHCRKAEKRHYLQISNGWDAAVWDSCSLMKIVWVDLKEIIFSVVCCIQSWRGINFWRTGKKSTHCKSVSFPFRKRGAIFRGIKGDVQSLFLI